MKKYILIAISLLITLPILTEPAFSGEKWEEYEVSDVRLSTRDDFYVEIFLNFQKPVSWRLKEDISPVPKGQWGEGTIEIVLTTPKEKGESAAKMIILVDTIDIVAARMDKNWINTKYTGANKLIPEGAELELKETRPVEGPVPRLMSAAKGIRQYEGKESIVSIYKAKDEDGKELKVYLYTTWALNVALTVGYIAEEDAYNKYGGTAVTIMSILNAQMTHTFK